MDERLTSHQTPPVQPPDLGDLMKSLMANAILLQVRPEHASLEKELQELVKTSLPPNCRIFSILPIGPGGRFKHNHRYLLIWSSILDAQCPSLSLDRSENAVDAISKATSRDGSEFLMHRTTKRDRERMVICLKKLEAEMSAKSTKDLPHETVLHVIQDVFGRPLAKPEFDTCPSLTHTPRKGSESDDTDVHSNTFLALRDVNTSEKEGERTEDGEITVSIKQQGSRPDLKRRAEQALDVGGTKSAGPAAPTTHHSRKRTRKDVASDSSGGMEAGGKAEELAWIMRLIADHGKKTGPGTGVTLAPPPPGHRTTSNLKPVVTKKPSPEPEAQDPFSPLDYKTPIGNASVVHKIYLEARRTTQPRTRAEEFSRRKRALQMAYKEILGVISDIEWHRKGTGFKSGPQSSVLVGLERVPDENKRPWLLEKLDVLKTRQCEVRCAIEENEEARRHLIAVMDAVLITLRAGPDGLVF